MDDRNIGKAKAMASSIWNKFLDYGYFDFRLETLAWDDSIVRLGFFGIRKLIMGATVLFMADEFQSIERMSIHDGFNLNKWRKGYYD